MREASRGSPLASVETRWGLSMTCVCAGVGSVLYVLVSLSGEAGVAAHACEAHQAFVRRSVGKTSSTDLTTQLDPHSHPPTLTATGLPL